ncbi:MAG: hypothetical protein ACOC9Y_04015 [Chloroflexota bacterium]
MTRKRHRRTERQARQSIEETREMARKAAQAGEPLDLDPASELFFQFAGPLLTQARTDEEFTAAAGIAEFVWASSHFDAATQGQLLMKFIAEAEIPEEMIPWLLEVYAELAERKQLLTG